jgi:hypothetical protein
MEQEQVMKEYILVVVSEHGDISVEELESDEVLQAIEDHGLSMEQLRHPPLEEKDPQYWRQQRGLLIKGKIVVPWLAERRLSRDSLSDGHEIWIIP